METVIGKIYDRGAPGEKCLYYEGISEHYIGSEQHHCKATEITFDGVSLRWCNCTLEHPATVEVESSEEFVELHYNMTGQSANSFGRENFDLYPFRHSMFYSNGYMGAHQITGDKNHAHTFMEVKLSRKIFERLNMGLTSGGSMIMDFMMDQQTGWLGKTAPISPEMLFLMASIRNCPYSGMMKRLYLEAKLMELYLAQLNSFVSDSGHAETLLKKADIKKIYEAREFIDDHYGETCSIINLAAQVGINQQKLKTGFRDLLGTTVFGYLREIRMQTAKRMLLDEKKSVGEAASEVGYKNPHHFTAAFKKRFGFLPSDLKE